MLTGTWTKGPCLSLERKAWAAFGEIRQTGVAIEDVSSLKFLHVLWVFLLQCVTIGSPHFCLMQSILES